MKTQLVTIETNDIPIDGAFHEPDGETCAAALYFHGNTMNFYTGGARFLAPGLTKLGIAVLAFNRRGHDILTTRASRAAEGGAFQTSAQAIADNRYAAQWLAARGFAVLGFPCNQFGGQEPGDAAQIGAFCSRDYGVTFPMFDKVEVNGAGAHPLYRWLTRAAPGLLGTERIKWNFTKFLVGRDGRVVKRYAPVDKPEAIASDIEKLLDEKGTP